MVELSKILTKENIMIALFIILMIIIIYTTYFLYLNYGTEEAMLFWTFIFTTLTFIKTFIYDYVVGKF